MNSLTLGKKLALSFAAMFVLVAILSCAVLVSLGTTQSQFVQMADVQVQELALAGQFDASVMSLRSNWRGTVLFAYAKDPSRVRVAEQGFQKSMDDAHNALQRLSILLTSPEERALAEDGAANLNRLESSYREYARLCEANEPDEANAYTDSNAVPALARLSEIGPKLVGSVKGSVSRQKADVISRINANRWTTSFVVLLAIVAGVWIAYVIREVTASLHNLTKSLLDGSSMVSSAASQVSSSSQQLAQGASEQAASLEETSSSTEEISSMTNKNAESAKLAATIVAKAGEDIEATNGKLKELITSMSLINESSNKISKIMKIIDEIAFQTNILALNAAVEAARAGEAGMGFAVVADEVRNLAQRCAQAAKDTAVLIEESMTNCRVGGEKLAIVTAGIQEISQGATEVKTLVEEVSVGSQEQAKGLEQIAGAIAQMEQVTHKTAASAEEGASAGAELSAQSESLREIVDHLTALVGA